MGFCIPPTLRTRDQRGALPAGRSALELSKQRETVGVPVGVSPESAESRLLSEPVRAPGCSASSVPPCRSLAASLFASPCGVRCAAGAAACVRVGGEQFRHLHHGDRVRSC